MELEESRLLVSAISAADSMTNDGTTSYSTGHVWNSCMKWMKKSRSPTRYLSIIFSGEGEEEEEEEE